LLSLGFASGMCQFPGLAHFHGLGLSASFRTP
jgi:hypothetical protein